MRPRVICHIAASIDGRIVVDGWPDTGAVRREYEAIHAAYEANAWIRGRITMEPFAGATRPDADVKREYWPATRAQRNRSPMPRRASVMASFGRTSTGCSASYSKSAPPDLNGIFFPSLTSR
jgi:hypothetical protein